MAIVKWKNLPAESIDIVDIIIQETYDIKDIGRWHGCVVRVVGRKARGAATRAWNKQCRLITRNGCCAI